MSHVATKSIVFHTTFSPLCVNATEIQQTTTKSTSICGRRTTIRPIVRLNFPSTVRDIARYNNSVSRPVGSMTAQLRRPGFDSDGSVELILVIIHAAQRVAHKITFMPLPPPLLPWRILIEDSTKLPWVGSITANGDSVAVGCCLSMKKRWSSKINIGLQWRQCMNHSSSSGARCELCWDYPGLSAVPCEA